MLVEDSIGGQKLDYLLIFIMVVLIEEKSGYYFGLETSSLNLTTAMLVIAAMKFAQQSKNLPSE